MRPDKEVKKEFKKIASKNPEKYYAVSVLKKEGFNRKQCKCGTYFWTTNKKQNVCGDAVCSGGFRFFDNNPAKEKLSYIDVWKRFSKMFEKKGYVVVKRYPVVSRWNPTTDFTMASIAAFQPFVVSGEVEPPAKMLVIPQFCLRFGDVDNVGVTMSHNTGFIMIGQHAFLPKEEWDQEKFFKDIFDWLTEGLGIPKEEITFHEDAWAGGGNYGPCMEFFCRGVELGNQVYMMFEQTPEGDRELRLKVLDMGMGHERVAWFTQAKGTQYDATFPTVIEKLLRITKVEYDEEFMKKYVPFAAFLNLDEIEDIDKAWSSVAKKIGVKVEELKKKIEPMTAIYTIAEHSRSLLFAIADGALPSNTGGGYNLRAIFRRAQSFIEKYNWNIGLGDVAEWHAQYLQELFPELLKNIEDVKKILLVEKQKFDAMKQNAKNIIENRLKEKKEFTEEELLMLYDSYGITPEQLNSISSEYGIKIEIPDKFYALVAEMHEKKEIKKEKEEFIDVSYLPKTEQLFYQDFYMTKFKAKVIKILNDSIVVLDKTAFYPTSGGQEHDKGRINNEEVGDVIKEAGVILHKMKKPPRFKEGDIIEGDIDFSRRLQIAQHHTAAHIINGAARKILGNHVWQAGASKTEEKGRLDITHYQSLSDKEIEAIENEANRIVKMDFPIEKEVISKGKAEKKYGFILYQGGVVPGKDLRIVKIGEDYDIEACGGTHLDRTGKVELIKILKASKISDAIVRIEFVAGHAAKNVIKKEKFSLDEVVKLLKVQREKVPSKARHIFEEWKALRKAVQKGKSYLSKPLHEEFFRGTDSEILEETARILNTTPEHVINTLSRFLREIEEFKVKLRK